MTRFWAAAFAYIACVAIGLGTAAQAQVAVVEDIKGILPGVEVMDYLIAGQTIKLDAEDTIVLSYLKSCQRETITGANVSVGIEQSDVQGGTVHREKSPCDGGKIARSVKLGQGGGMVFRDISKGAKLLLAPQFTLYGLSPAVDLNSGIAVLIERMDQPGEHYELTPAGHKLRGSLYDFADDNKELIPGGVYRATMGSVQVQFQIDRNAQPGHSPLAGRLLRLQGSN